MPERKRPQVEVEPWFDHLIDHFKQWARELGVDIDALSITDSAGKKKKPPMLRNRATQMRFREGRAFEIRHDLYTALSKLESSMSAPTATGKMMVGVEEWARVGQAWPRDGAAQRGVLSCGGPE